MLLASLLLLSTVAPHGIRLPLIDRIDQHTSACSLAPHDRVLILGAGLAGLSAAQTLLHQGCHKKNIRVLEANTRVGGRVFTLAHQSGQSRLFFKKISGERGQEILSLDLGAGWIHAPRRDNPIYDLAMRLGLDVQVVPGDSAYIGGHGIQLFAQSTSQRLSWAHKAHGFYLARRFFTLMKQTAAQLELRKQDMSMADFVQLAFDKFNLEPDSNQRRLLMWHVDVIYQGDYAAPLEDLSLCAMARDGAPDAWMEGDAVLRQGYGQMTDYLAQGLDIELGAMVQRIDYSATDGAVRVHLLGGRVYEAEKVIFTLPLPFMKDESMFNPPLPQPKLEALDKMGMGLLNRVLLRYETPFWSTSSQQYTFGFVPQTELQDLVWSMMVNLEYEHRPNSRGILQFMVGGKSAQKLYQYDQRDIVMTLHHFLLKAFRPRHPVPAPEYFFSDWKHNAYSLGSYSFPKVGFKQGDVRVMRESLDGRVFFAGEHLDLEGEFATTQGAYRSGIQAALDVLGSINREDQNEKSFKLT